jgi:alpha-ribazole phosphatase
MAPPGGETFAALHARVADALAGIAEGTLVVCHAGVIRAARMILTGASFETAFAEKVPFCEPLTFGGG